MARHHMTPDGAVPFSEQEETEADAREASARASKPLRRWQASIAQADSDLMPRWAEDIISKLGTTELAPETIQKFNEKQALRSQKPE